MIIAVGAGKGSPGASTTALALTLTWPEPVLLVEADPAGGDLRFGYAVGADLGPRGLLAFSVAARRAEAAEALWDNVIALGPQRWALPGVDGPHQSVDLGVLVSALSGLEVDVVCDLGRVPGPVAPRPLLGVADTALLVTRSTLPGVRAAQQAAPQVTRAVSLPAKVVIGPGRPYGASEVAAAMAEVAPVAGTLPWDPATAAVLSAGAPAPRRMDHSPLMRAATQLARSLAGGAAQPAQPEEAEEAEALMLPAEPEARDVSLAAGRVPVGRGELR